MCSMPPLNAAGSAEDELNFLYAEHVDDLDAVEREENRSLDVSTVSFYQTHLRSFEKYLEEGVTTIPEYASMLISPRVQPRPRAE